jgi:hypothetical protein
MWADTPGIPKLESEQKAAPLRKEIEDLERLPNKTPAIKQHIDRLKAQLRREIDRMRASEEHARKGQH